jgi:hypothetical protein
MDGGRMASPGPGNGGTAPFTSSIKPVGNHASWKEVALCPFLPGFPGRMISRCPAAQVPVIAARLTTEASSVTWRGGSAG